MRIKNSITRQTRFNSSSPVEFELSSDTQSDNKSKIEKFYQSIKWKRVRNYKRALARGVCEICGKAGWEVHHIVPVTIKNVDDPDISLNLNNLMLLCTSCHNSMRRKSKQLRDDLEFDCNGNLIKKRTHR